MTTRFRFSRWTYLIMILVLAGVFTGLNRHLFQTHAFASTQMGSSASTRPDKAASNQMIAQLTAKLGSVKGLNDMVVLPSTKVPGAYLVSATVDATSVKHVNSEWMNADVDAFFKGVYNGYEPIAMAELTFTSGEQILASAGLGKSAYETLASSTMSGDLASTLKSRLTNTSGTEKSAWFQMTNTQ